MHRFQTSALFATLILALSLASGSSVRAAEIYWNNTADNNLWTTSGSNWFRPSGTTLGNFRANDAVVFGADTTGIPNTDYALPGIISITPSGGVTIGSSGTNPGMIVMGDGNWTFIFTGGVTGTAAAAATNHGITGDGAGVLMQGTGTLTFSMTTGYTGATDVANGTLRLGVVNAIAHSNNVSISNGATLDLGGNNQALRALTLAQGAKVVFSGTGANYAKLTLDTLAGNGGAFAMRTDLSIGAGDQIVLAGANSGTHTLVFSNSNSATPKPSASLMVVSVSSTQNNNAIFNGATEDGIYAYNVEQGKNGSWYLVEGTRLSRAADAIISSAAVAGQDWHYSLDSLYKRMGDLREPPFCGAGAEGSGNLWMRANHSRLNAKSSLSRRGFHQYHYGVSFGADKALGMGAVRAANDMIWHLGGFGDVQHVSRKFDNNGNGSTTAIGAGAYLAWIHTEGWYADAIVRFDRNKNKFKANATDGYATGASYGSNITGMSVEFGRRLYWSEDWWIEPAFQFALASIGGASCRHR